MSETDDNKYSYVFSYVSGVSEDIIKYRNKFNGIACECILSFILNNDPIAYGRLLYKFGYTHDILSRVREMYVVWQNGDYVANYENFGGARELLDILGKCTQIGSYIKYTNNNNIIQITGLKYNEVNYMRDQELQQEMENRRSNYEDDEKDGYIPPPTTITECPDSGSYYKHNNICFIVQRNGIGKEYIGGSSGYPPFLVDYRSIEVCYINTVAAKEVNNEDEIFNYESIIGDTETTVEKVNPNGEGISEKVNINALCNYEFINDTSTFERVSKTDSNSNDVFAISEKKTLIKPIYDQTKDLKTHLIKNKRVKWWITVPVRISRDKVIKVKMLADTGANAGCIDTKFAIKYFSNFIVHNKNQNTLKTPGGLIHPKFVLYLLFPTLRYGTLKARMYLVNDLPVSIIAGLNMLTAFGYDFEDDTPPVFKHEEEHDLDLGLKSEESSDIHVPVNGNHTFMEGSFNDYKVRKHLQYAKESKGESEDAIDYTNDVAMCDTIKSNDYVLYTQEHGSLCEEGMDE